MKKLLLVLFLLLAANCFGQNRNSVWCFGDSAGIDFSNLSNPVPNITSLRTRGSSVNIADSTGNLLFYANTRAGIAPNSGLVWAKNHTLMMNGDSILGQGWYNEMVIIPFPNNDSLFYLFSLTVTSSSWPAQGLYYSLIDLRQNSGLGSVTQKNVQLQSFTCVDGINAIKHANGRDWWIFFRRFSSFSPGNNEFHSYLITPNGITNYNVQQVGFMQATNAGQLTFSQQGDKIVYNDARGLIEKYDFDRCTGIISNPVNIQPEFPTNLLWFSNEISADGNVLYVSTSNTPSYLFQYDLTAANIAATKDTIYIFSNSLNAGGHLKRAPDNKIYLSNAYISCCTQSYPYADSMYNSFNMYLSVINSPDSLGVACNFQPYSFYLDGKRTYWGLPNNPDYEMPALAGSPCDTITSTPNIHPTNTTAQLQLTYITSWQTLFANAQNLKSKNCLLQLYDVSGKLIYTTTQKTVNGYFTCNIPLQTIAKGLYVVKLVGDKEVLGKRFVKE